MMKKANIKKFTVSALLGVLLCFGCVFGIAGVPVKADAAGGITKTWEIDTSFRTRVTTELSKATDFKGGTIEFDLLSSDLKDDYNINGICSSMGNHQAGVSYDDFTESPYSYRRLNYASINFNFHKLNVDMNDYAWRVGGMNDTTSQNENQLSSFSYYADGRIVEYSDDAGDYTNRYQRIITPSTDGFVGTQEDIDFFMTPRYSYRVEWVWGNVSADKTVTVFTPEQMNSLGSGYRQGWYVAYSKPMSAPDSDYKVLFAFRTRAVYRLQNAINDNTLGMYAGFEISSNHGDPRQYNDGVYSEASHNVKMELDNVAIYEGYDYASSEKKGKTDFESTYTGLTGLNESGIKNAGRVNSDRGKYAGNFASSNWDRHDTAVDGLRVQITNAGKECIETYATSELKDRTVRTVSFTDGENVLFTQNVIDGFAATMPGNRVNDKFYRWNTDGKNLDSVTQNIEIVGTATDKRYITYDANGGSGSVERAEETVGSVITLPSGDGLSKTNYRIIGWSFAKDGEAEYTLSGEFTVPDDDITLYAVWELVSYKVKFTMPDGTELETADAVHGYSAFYRGKIPATDGKKFIGWNESVNGITQETTLVAQFDDGYDEFVDNKVVYVNFGAAVTKAETLAFYRKLSQNDGVRIRLDISGISGFDKVELMLGGSDGVKVDITEYAKNYTTVLFETDEWTYSVYAKPLDCPDEEFELKTRKNMIKSVSGGNFGVDFVTSASGAPTLSLNELSIREKNDLQTDAMQWGANVALAAGGETVVGGVTGVSSTVAATLTAQDKPRDLKVEFKDDASGEIIAERYCYSGGTATAPKVKGYTYDFANENNVTASKQISGTGTKNSYTATFSAERYEFESKQFGYGDKVTLPTAADKDIPYRIIVGWAETQDAAEYTYKAGEEISFNADENVTLYPVWGLKTYTVTYLGEDGSVLYIEKVPHGASASYGGETPQKDGYSFDGWDPYPTTVTQDISVRVVFKSLAQNKFRVIVADGTGSGSYAAGETVTIAADEKNGFDFKSWSTENDIEITYKDGVYSFVMPNYDVSVAATYKEKTTFASLVRDVFIWVTLALFVVAAGAFTFVFIGKKKNK